MTRRGALLGALLLATWKLTGIARGREQSHDLWGKELHFAPSAWEPKPFSLTFDFTQGDGGASALVLKFPTKTITFTRDELQREFENGGGR